MKTLKYILFFASALIFFQGCGKDDWSPSFADDELPKIYFSNWSGIQTAGIGTTLKWVPIVSPSDGATFKWTKNGEVLSEEKDFEYTMEILEEFELKFEVTRNGISTHRVADIIATKPFEPKVYNKKVIAYIDAMDGTLSDINWDAITHIVISSLIVGENEAGSGVDAIDIDFEFTGSTLDINTLVALAHNNGVYVSLQVSGKHNKVNSLPSYEEATFYNAINTPEKRNFLITTLLDFVEETGLDGLDIYMDKPHDGAYPSADTRAHVASFYQELADRVPTENADGFDFYLSISTYVGWLRDHNTAFASIDRYDWVSVLAIAQEDLTPVPHSSAWSCSDNAAFWIANGVPAEKIIITSPAFSITYDLEGRVPPTWPTLEDYTQYGTYRDLLISYPDAHNANSQDVASGLFYDGFPAIEEKAQMVIDNNYAGMALWKISDDVKDERSLITKINTALGN